MTNIRIVARREYELYVKEKVSKMEISNKQKAIVREVSMAAFDDGTRFIKGQLEVRV